MITIMPTPRSIVTFDGYVIDVFPEWRKHIGLLRDIELRTDKRGKHTLYISDIYSSGEINVDEEAVPKVNLLIAEVKRARAEFKPD